MKQTAPPASTPSASPATTQVAYLGPRGTFTEQAVLNLTGAGHLPSDVVHRTVSSPAAALDLVRSGEVDRAVVALESSVDGPVTQTFDSLASGVPVQILREHDVPVVFSILVRPGTRLQDVRTFTTHPVAEAQVRRWLGGHLPDASFVPASSNGAAAAAVAAGEADAAAAPARAGEIHGLESLADGVADVAGAHTRFVLVGLPQTPTPRTGHDRTAIVLQVPNVPASLVMALMELATRRVDMSRIESRPTREKAGTYHFHVEIVGHLEDAAVSEALAGLHRYCERIRFLGSWPQEGWVGGADGPDGSVPPDYAASWDWVRQLAEGGPA
ncbi:MAG: prephenate dehydratase [Corynebacterium sp.]|uniref:prephenate dehydratase n=1 Tax=unclassified Corynebacterium TaxID=2624378 RepID=UPI00264A292E|nr:prephenate dehydratase [Corynebacterium sp.]MDN5720413.1 prephenate dehydratase [Corynebacterium sp.]MDN6324897.1 prephenate dehydratase [Corynebacterium sp.]